jgi:hypothetical protein
MLEVFLRYTRERIFFRSYFGDENLWGGEFPLVDATVSCLAESAISLLFSCRLQADHVVVTTTKDLRVIVYRDGDSRIALYCSGLC